MVTLLNAPQKTETQDWIMRLNRSGGRGTVWTLVIVNVHVSAGRRFKNHLVQDWFTLAHSCHVCVHI